MGLRDWVRGLLAGEQAETDDDGPALVVDVERRAGAILEQYGLSGGEARRVAEILSEELGREEGYARTMIADRIARAVDVDEDRARTIVDTEVASVRNLARVRRFVDEGGEDVRVRWVDSVGNDDSPVCAAVRDRVDERGAVTVAELREVLREAAAAHESGTPDRADDLVPHEGCRHTVVRHME